MDNFCYNHPNRTAVNECQDCHQPVCETCDLEYYRRRKFGNVRVTKKLRLCPQCYLKRVKFKVNPIHIILPAAFFLLISAVPFYDYFTSDSPQSIVGPLLFGGFGLLIIIVIMSFFISSKRNVEKAAEMRVKGILDGTIQ